MRSALRRRRIRRRAHSYGRSRRDAARRTGEQRVALRQAALDLDSLRLLVAKSELDLDPLDLTLLEPDHERPDARDVDRVHRGHERIPPLGGDATLGEQPADEVVARVR